MTPDAMVYPVLTIPAKETESIGSAKTLQDLITCSKYALRNGYYDNMLIVDSTGAFFRVSKVLKANRPGSVLASLLALFARTTKAELSLEPVDAQPLNDFKQKMVNTIGHDAEYWENLTSSHDIAEVVASIQRCRDYCDLVGLPFFSSSYPGNNT